MTTLFTEHDLIRYIYGESTETEKTEIESASALDTNLQEEIWNLKSGVDLLDKLSLDPTDFALKKIFNFSSSFEVNPQ